MKKTTVALLALVYLIGMGAQAQNRKTKEAKVVLIVNEKTESVIGISLFSNFQKMNKETVVKKYPDCRFFIGLLKGGYELNKNSIEPSKGTTVTMYTNKQFFPGDNFYPDDNFTPGDDFTLGRTQAKVVSRKKGELVLRTQ